MVTICIVSMWLGVFGLIWFKSLFSNSVSSDDSWELGLMFLFFGFFMSRFAFDPNEELFGNGKMIQFFHQLYIRIPRYTGWVWMLTGGYFVLRSF